MRPCPHLPLLVLVVWSLLFPVRDSVSQFHRLQLPDPESELQIVPRIEVPMSMAPSIQSGMNIRLPISLKFARRDGSRELDGRLTAKSMSPQEVLNSTRAETRVSFYRAIETASPRIGKACVLRSICEVAQIPSISPATGLLGEIVDLLLTCSNFVDADGSLVEYRDAEHFGKVSWKSDACKRRYAGCPFSVFSIVSLFARN